MTRNVDFSKSLEEIEAIRWGEPTYDSHLVTTCHRLRHKPLSEFTIEDLRIMIGQSISLPVLIPLALERLKEAPLAEGDFFPGDLLSSVLRAEKTFWENHPDLSEKLQTVVRDAREKLTILDHADCYAIREILQRQRLD